MTVTKSELRISSPYPVMCCMEFLLKFIIRPIEKRKTAALLFSSPPQLITVRPSMVMLKELVK